MSNDKDKEKIETIKIVNIFIEIVALLIGKTITLKA